MTPNDDYVDGMGTPLVDDEAIEAFFLGTGQSSWAQDDALVTLAEEVLVATGGRPPRPHGALLAFLDAPAPRATPTLVSAPAVAPAAASPWKPQAAAAPAAPTDRPNLRLVLSRRLRLTAGIAAGIGIAAAAFTVAGTTGVLPDPAMRAIVRVVEAVTPFELSEPGKPPTSPAPVTRSTTTSTVAAPPATASVPVGESEPTQPPPANTHPSTGSVPPSAQAPVQPGSTGLDRAAEAPAGPFIPPFVTGGPGPTPGGDGGGPPSTGVDRARETPAGTFIPPFAGGPPGRR